MAQDYDRFCALWARLEIREDSRFSFHDVEQRGAGERIGLCIWDLSNSLHDKSVTGELPAWVGKVIPKFADPALQRGRPEKGPAVLFGWGGDGGLPGPRCTLDCCRPCKMWTGAIGQAPVGGAPGEQRK